MSKTELTNEQKAEIKLYCETLATSFTDFLSKIWEELELGTETNLNQETTSNE